ncbi:MAG: FapA family protein, partial [Treponema sp.]|nr:FapA family protein [Treponema sp.]
MAESVKESESPHSSRNAEARVDINPDKTRAVLYLRKGQDASRHLDIKTISQAIRDSGVHGFDSEALKNTISGFLEGKDEELKDYSLAEGIPSTRGKDREVTVEAVLLQDEEKEQAAERLIEWNSRDSLRNSGIDPQKADGFAYVEKDAVVARVASGTGGEAGKDIFGNTVPGLPGNDPDIKLLQGLEIHGSEITASQKGLFLFGGSGKSFRGAVIDYLDAKITVHVSDDAMEARGDLCREEGAGIPLTVENVKNALTGLGIIKGVDWEAVEKACARAREKGCVTGLVLARGKAPLARGSPEPHWLVSMDPFGSSGAGAGGGTVSGPVSGEAADSAGTTAPNKITAPNEITATGCSAAQVKAGVHVLELSGPAEEGHPGYDVKGTVIPIEKASVFSVEHDDSIREIQQGA